MLPEKKKILISGTIAIVALIGVVLVIYFITAVIKKKNTEVFISDPYPKEYVYLGVRYDAANGYEVILPMKSDFTHEKGIVRSFEKIKDAKVVDNRLVIFSDLINEVAYNKKDGTFFLREINSYSNKEIETLKLTNNYFAYLDVSGALEYQDYAGTLASDPKLITVGVTDKNIAVRRDVVYYKTSEGILEYNLETEEKRIIVADNGELNPVIVKYNFYYILLNSSKGFIVYDLRNDKQFVVNDTLSKIIDINSLYARGFSYTKYNPYRLISYNMVIDDFESVAYAIPAGYVLNNMYYINDVNCYMDLIDGKNEHKYMVMNVKTMEIVATLDGPYEHIYKVQ